MLQYLTGSKEKVYQLAINLDILQPLFKGAGRRIAQENLVQAEREVVYQIRSFLRFQKTLAVSTAEKYFTLLQLKSKAVNYWNNYQYLKQTRERIEMLSQAGRISPSQADQARQDEYRAYQQWLQAKNSYEMLLDDFKIFLGVSPEIKISLEEKEIRSFLTKGVPKIDIEAKDFITLALQKRLDLMNASEQLEDARRKVKIALNELRTKLDLNVNVESTTSEKSYLTSDFKQPSYQTGLEFELPLNKVQERNAYREALITLERKKREISLKKDQIKLEVLNAYRDLQESYQTYLIQKNSLELASKRVESTDLLLQAGRATIRDLLEAQEAYLNAKNNLSNAITEYLISYLKFLRDTELLELDERGVWKGELYEKISGEDFQE